MLDELVNLRPPQAGELGEVNKADYLVKRRRHFKNPVGAVWRRLYAFGIFNEIAEKASGKVAVSATE